MMVQYQMGQQTQQFTLLSNTVAGKDSMAHEMIRKVGSA
jgi:hypothetical protein